MLMGAEFARQNAVMGRAAVEQPRKVIMELKHKKVFLWRERFGWACVIMWSDIWKELPIEINKMIVNLLVETHWQCRVCDKFVKELPFQSMCCSKECKDKHDTWYTFYGHSNLMI